MPVAMMHPLTDAQLLLLPPSPCFAQLVVMLVGVNNLLSTKPWEKLDFLLNTYFATAMPATKILVVAPLPSFHNTSATLTREYR